MSRKRPTVDGEEEDVADEEEKPSVDTPAPKRQRVAKMRAVAKLASHTDDMTVDDTQTSRSASGDHQQQLGDAAQSTTSRRPLPQRTPPSRMETLLSQVPVEVWERVVPRLDAGGALALFSINTHMVDMGDLYQVDNQPLRSTLVSTLGKIGGVVVKFGDKRHRVPRLNRLYLNRTLFELFGENSVPERMHAKELPSLCGRSLPVLYCVLRRTTLSESWEDDGDHYFTLLGAVDRCLPFQEAIVGVMSAAGAPEYVVEDIDSDSDSGEFGNTVWGNVCVGEADSKGRTLADVPLSNIVAHVKRVTKEGGGQVWHTASALTQVFVGHGLAGVKEAMAVGLSGCERMLACIAEMLPEAEWPKALQAVCESEKNLTLLRELANVLDNRALVSCVLSTLPMDTLVVNAPADALHNALVLVKGEETAMATLVEHATLLFEAAQQYRATAQWIASTPEIVSQLDNDAVVQLYRMYYLQQLLAVLVEREAWKEVIDMARPGDLTEVLDKNGMVLPHELVLPFLKCATGVEATTTVEWVLVHHGEQLDDDTVSDVYKACPHKEPIRVLVERKAWEMVVDIARPSDLRAALDSKGMVLPQEHVLPFLERARGGSSKEASAAVEWVLVHHEEQLDDDTVAELYKKHRHKEAIRLLVERRAWEMVIDIARPSDLRAALDSKGMVLPQEHVMTFIKRARKDPTIHHRERIGAVRWAVEQHTAQLGLETVLECYRCDHDQWLLPVLLSKDNFEDDDRALWVPYELKENTWAEAIRVSLQERWQQQVHRCVSVCREIGAEAFVEYVRQWMSRTVGKEPCNDSEVMAVAMEGLENADLVKVGKLVNAEELETGRWSKELATEAWWMQLLDDGFPLNVLGIIIPRIDGSFDYSEELQWRIVRGLIEQGMSLVLSSFLKRSSKLDLAKDVYPYLYELDSSTALEKLHEIRMCVDNEVLLALLQQYKDPQVLERLISRIPFMLVTKGMYQALGGENFGVRTQKRWDKVEKVRQECHAQRGHWGEWALDVLSWGGSVDTLIPCQVLLECGYEFGEQDWTDDVSEEGANFLASLGIRVSGRAYSSAAHRDEQTEELKRLREVYSAFEK